YMYGAGTRAMLAQTDNTLVVGNWHHIKLVVTKTGLAGYVDDVEMFNLEHAQWTDGSVGIQAYNGMMDFDDFIVYGPAGRKSLPTASGPTPANGELIEATWAQMSWRSGDFAVSHDLYIGADFDDVNNGAEGTFAGNTSSNSQIVGFTGYPMPQGLQPGTTYYWRVDEVNDADPNSPWKGDVWSFSVVPQTAYNPDPVSGAEFVDPNAIFTWMPGYGAKLHTVHLGDNFDDVYNATSGVPAGSPSYDPGTLEREKVLYWRVDEFDGLETHKGDVWSFTTPGAVGNPQPVNGAADVQKIATLSWTAADNAASHELYFGTDAEAVKNATTASLEYLGPRALGAESYDPGGLAWDSSYAWRVDEVYPSGTVKGLVWTFATADFILVDDFESYDDIDPPPGELGINRIFDKWIDGFETTTNGALVGNDLPPYAEQSIVHGGGQSMIYRYDNANKTSEATLTLVYPRDWTEEGVTKLVLWFRGASANAADRMFVALNGTSAVYHDNASATQMTGWNRWIINLQAFAGVNLTDVNTITIGIGTKGSPAAGGTGTLYFDDIRLTR
ncbi:MAG: fibronectin type III domain-containing protein, partial [Planctomycetota bacterium]